MTTLSQQLNALPLNENAISAFTDLLNRLLSSQNFISEAVQEQAGHALGTSMMGLIPAPRGPVANNSTSITIEAVGTELVFSWPNGLQSRVSLVSVLTLVLSSYMSEHPCLCTIKEASVDMSGMLTFVTNNTISVNLSTYVKSAILASNLSPAIQSMTFSDGTLALTFLDETKKSVDLSSYIKTVASAAVADVQPITFTNASVSGNTLTLNKSDGNALSLTLPMESPITLSNLGSGIPLLDPSSSSLTKFISSIVVSSGLVLKRISGGTLQLSLGTISSLLVTNIRSATGKYLLTLSDAGVEITLDRFIDANGDQLGYFDGSKTLIISNNVQCATCTCLNQSVAKEFVVSGDSLPIPSGSQFKSLSDSVQTLSDSVQALSSSITTLANRLTLLENNVAAWPNQVATT
jgi:hypothetical protein